MELDGHDVDLTFSYPGHIPTNVLFQLLCAISLLKWVLLLLTCYNFFKRVCGPMAM